MRQTLPHFEYRLCETAGIPTVVAIGEIDVASAPVLREVLLSGVPEAGTPSLIVDLSQVAFIDSEGLRALLAARSLAPDRLALAGIPPPVRRVLTITGTDRLFLLASSSEEAALLLRNQPREGHVA